jgi:ribosomal-protein-alanine N-acetyltransferase
MLKGKVVTLRPIRATDVDALYEFHVDIDNRGEFFPQGLLSQPAFQKQFLETGFWGKDEGMLTIIKPDGELIGHIEFFKTVDYLDEYELSYQIYSPVNRGKGAATEAVQMLVRYLFESRPVNRIRLVVHPDNTASRRLAARCGFLHEGTARGAWYNRGKHHDVEIYAIVHDDVIAKDSRP